MPQELLRICFGAMWQLANYVYNKFLNIELCGIQEALTRPSRCQVQKGPREALEVSQSKYEWHRQNLRTLIPCATNDGSLEAFQSQISGCDYSVKVYVDRRHSKICRGHQIPLIGAHSSNKSRVRHSIESTIVSYREVTDLPKGP